MKVLTVEHVYDPNPVNEMGDREITKVFDGVKPRIGWDFLRIRVEGGYLHVYADAVLFFPDDDGVAGHYVWRVNPAK